MTKNYLPLVSLLLCAHVSSAQFFFRKQTSVTVSESSRTLGFPWSGGLNNPQFSAADLNNDGTLDLVVFDRTGNKAITFLNNGASGAVDYEYAPEYEQAFSGFSQWMLMKDFDCDGIEDVFTYNIGAIDYYKGKYDSLNHLVFDSVTYFDYTSFSGILPIFVSSIDIPAVEDINNDGDLDVLTFDQLGGVVGYYENQSQELSGTCADTIYFERLENCWGTFYELTTTNVVALDTCGGFKREQSSAGPRHPGSTLLAFDEDGDGDKELILGDISFEHINRLVNGGTPAAAHIVAQDEKFPSYDVSYQLPIFPATFYVDVNNDNLRDLLVAPNATRTSENFNCSWYYKNVGAPDSAVFSFQTDTFLVHDMIDLGEGAYPAFFDYNGDGLLDLVVGNYGYYVNGVTYRSGLALFENIGDSVFPQYRLINRNYENISALARKAIAPAFGDMDDDGDADLIVGEFDGFLHYYENTAAPGSPATFALSLIQMYGIDVGQFSAPFIYDVNGDSLLDILVGEKSGNTNYFENKGTKTAMLFDTLPTNNFFGRADVRIPGFPNGYSTPVLSPLDSSGKIYMLSGCEEGAIRVFEFNRDSIYSGSFRKKFTYYSGIDEGERSTIAVADLTGDGKLEMVAGNYRGGTSFFSQSDSLVIPVSASQPVRDKVFVNVYPNPAHDWVEVEVKGFSMQEDVTFLLLDLLGKNQAEMVARGETLMRFHFPPLPSGMYFLNVRQGGETVTKKLLLTR